jgi:hypothetical protein
LQDPPKFTQIWIFGLKTNHLATLVATLDKLTHVDVYFRDKLPFGQSDQVGRIFACEAIVNFGQFLNGKSSQKSSQKVAKK